MTAIAASSLPSLEAEEEGGLFLLALWEPCMILSCRVMLAGAGRGLRSPGSPQASSRPPGRWLGALVDALGRRRF